MTEQLDLSIGRGIAKDLCDDCAKRLEQKINRTHIVAAMTPWGYKRLVKLIDDNTCNLCRAKIWRAGAGAKR